MYTLQILQNQLRECEVRTIQQKTPEDLEDIKRGNLDDVGFTADLEIIEKTYSALELRTYKLNFTIQNYCYMEVIAIE